MITQNSGQTKTKCVRTKVIKRFKFYNYIVYYKLDYYERLMYNSILNIKNRHYYIKMGFIPKLGNKESQGVKEQEIIGWNGRGIKMKPGKVKFDLLKFSNVEILQLLEQWTMGT